MSRIYNFSAGPATLPEEVLREAQAEFLDYKGSGMSIIESSHRGKEYAAIHQEAGDNIRQLLNVSDDYAVLFLQGGASGQFYMLPMNLLTPETTADYINSGAWAKKAIKEAQLFGNVNVAADTSADTPARMATQEELQLTPGARYLHFTSNETIGGTRFVEFPQADVPLVADMSSEMLSRPFDVGPFGMIYAGAQKNLGPAGVTLVIVRKDFVADANEKIPSFLQYKQQIDKDSLLNTGPCFSTYIVTLVTRWLLKNGGLTTIAQRNEAKAAKLYEAIDSTDFFSGTAAVANRSLMNVTFRLPTEDLEAKFIAEAAEQGMKGLKGHRSVGGIRASIYNAFPAEGVDALVTFMKQFEQANG